MATTNIFEQAASRASGNGIDGTGPGPLNPQARAAVVAAQNKAALDAAVKAAKVAASKSSNNKAPTPDLNPQAQNATGPVQLNAAQLGAVLSPNDPSTGIGGWLGRGLQAGADQANLQALADSGYPSGGYPTGGGSNGTHPAVSSGIGGSVAAPVVSPATGTPDYTWGIPDYVKQNLENPYLKPYDAAIAAAHATGAASLASMSQARSQIAGNYDQASQGMYDQYQNSRKPLDAQAAALGPATANIYKGYDESLRKIQENNDQAKAGDQSWFDKMQALRGSSLDSLYVGLNHDKAQGMAQWSIAQAARDAASQKLVTDARIAKMDAMGNATLQNQLLAAGGGKSGGGGKGGRGRSGGRSSGRGGSSGTINGVDTNTLSNTDTTTGTNTDTVTDPNFLAIYNDPSVPDNVKQQLLANQILTGGNKNAQLSQQQYDTQTGKANQTYSDYTKANGLKTGWSTGLMFPGTQDWGKGITQAQKDAAVSLATRNAALGLGGVAGIPESKQTVVNKGVQVQGNKNVTTQKYKMKANGKS